jgi:tetratricopeptide (TPR) repeat protein
LRIVDGLSGHTQAISIAAAQLARRGHDFASTLVNRLEKHLRTGEPFQDLQFGEDEDRQLNLEASLYLSYEDLSDDLKRLFKVLGVFVSVGTFDANAVEFILNRDLDNTDVENDTPNQQNIEDVEDKLDALVDAALVIRHEKRRYSLHRVIKFYALGLLKRTGESGAILSKFTAYYLRRAIDFQRLPPEQWINDDWPQIYELGDHCVIQIAQTQYFPDVLDKLRELSDSVIEREEIDLVVAETFALAIQTHVMLRNIGVHGLCWLLAGLVASRSTGTKENTAELADAVGNWYEAHGETEQVVKYFFQSAEIWHTLRNIPMEALVVVKLAGLYAGAGKIAESRKLLEIVEKSSEYIEDEAVQANLWTGMTNIYCELGDYTSALQYGFKALAICKKLDNQYKHMQAAILNNIGSVYLRTHSYDEADDYLNRALELVIQVGDVRRQATCLLNIGLNLKNSGDSASALEYFNASIILAAQVDDPRAEHMLCWEIVMIYWGRGLQHEAIQMIERARYLKAAFDLSTDKEDTQLHQWRSSLGQDTVG